MRTYTESQVMATLRLALKTCSQRELAQALGYPESNLSDVLNGKRPLAESLAQALGFTKLATRYRKTEA